MITCQVSGNYNNIRKFLKKNEHMSLRSVLDKYGRLGVEALAKATPVDTGKTADSWSYEVEKTREGYTISWKNSNVNHGVPIALILQYGHGTGTGGYVQGTDYINPAMRKVFQELADDAWKEVKDS